MKKLKTLFALFFAMFKIGLFTFGGGYAMIAIIERELVERKKWIEHEEFLDVIAIAESTPGPLAINAATYIGYKIGGVLGSVFATLGVVLPSFTIIYLISLVFDKFLSLVWVQYAFRGIQACVAFLILSAGFKMLKKLKKNIFNVVFITLTIGCLVGFSLFAIDFSSIFYILIGGVVGLTVYLIGYIKSKKSKTVIDTRQESEKANGGEE
ncbi:MAG: chromate transporter [Clostridia bacterium]|nr:chromate transporter [Clostridia bacterium]